jgi:hypothetical protein
MILGIRSAGLARAGRQYKSLADNKAERQNVTKLTN